MRKRYAVALIAAVSLAATGGLVYADPFAGADVTAPASTASPAVVTLPTSDRLQVPPDGPLLRLDDTGMRFTRLPNGDRVAIPFSALSRVRSGESDERLYNVDALLRSGHSDARRVDDPSRLGERFMDDRSHTKAGSKVSVKGTWIDGSEPSGIDGIWVNLDTGDSGGIGGEGGTGSVELPPGDYGFVFSMIKVNGSAVDLVATTADLTVTDEQAIMTVDGEQAKPMGFTVDAAEAQVRTQDVTVFVGAGSGHGVEATVNGMGGDSKLYAIPSDEPDGHPAGVSVQSALTSPSGSDESYVYNLNRTMSDGISGDPMTTVHDDELAAREMNYRGLGGPESTIARADYADTAVMPAMAAAFASTAPVPSKRTEYFTASPGTKWGHFGQMNQDSSSSVDEMQRYSGAMKAGKDELSWLSAPLSVGVPSQHDWTAMMARLPYEADEQSPQLALRPPLFDSADAGETMGSWQVGGKATISKDGQTLATSQDGSIVSVHLPKDDSGRYTATFEAERDAKWTPLGTRSTATWKFDSAPVEEYTPLGVSTVRFNASGVTNGYADRAAGQKVALDFVTHGGAEDRSCARMTFQVSYDDGKTWKKVKISRDGDHATATLKHPAGAKFVSVKFSAEDDRGQTVTTSTIRSYGLK